MKTERPVEYDDAGRAMHVTLLGTGGPRPDPTRQGPATLVQAAGLNLVFDAGRGVASQLVKAGVPASEVDAIFVTHHHFDHIGGLGDLMMAAWLIGRTVPLAVYGPRGTAEIIEALFEGVYRRDIAYRIAEEQMIGQHIVSPVTMVQVHEMMRGTVDIGRGVQVEVRQVEHGGKVLDFDEDEWASVGYRISADERSVAISGDAITCEGLTALAAHADVLVMCAYLGADEIGSPAEQFLVDHVLAGAPQAAAIARDSSVRTLVLTHIREKPPEQIERMLAQTKNLFGGEVIVGRDLLAIDV